MFEEPTSLPTITKQKPGQKQGPIGQSDKRRKYPVFYRHGKDIKYKSHGLFPKECPKIVIPNSRLKTQSNLR